MSNKKYTQQILLQQLCKTLRYIRWNKPIADRVRNGVNSFIVEFFLSKEAVNEYHYRLLYITV